MRVSASVVPSDRDELGLLPESRSANPSAVFSRMTDADSTLPLRWDLECGTAWPPRRSAPARRDKEDSTRDRKHRGRARLRADCEHDNACTPRKLINKNYKYFIFFIFYYIFFIFFFIIIIYIIFFFFFIKFLFFLFFLILFYITNYLFYFLFYLFFFYFYFFFFFIMA